MRTLSYYQRQHDAREPAEGDECGLDPDAAEALADMRAADVRAYYAAFCDDDCNDILF